MGHCPALLLRCQHCTHCAVQPHFISRVHWKRDTNWNRDTKAKSCENIKHVYCTPYEWHNIARFILSLQSLPVMWWWNALHVWQCINVLRFWRSIVTSAFTWVSEKRSTVVVVSVQLEHASCLAQRSKGSTVVPIHHKIPPSSPFTNSLIYRQCSTVLLSLTTGSRFPTFSCDLFDAQQSNQRMDIAG